MTFSSASLGDLERKLGLERRKLPINESELEESAASRSISERFKLQQATIDKVLVNNHVGECFATMGLEL
jgi:hypothetical protein